MRNLGREGRRFRVCVCVWGGCSREIRLKFMVQFGNVSFDQEYQSLRIPIYVLHTCLEVSRLYVCECVFSYNMSPASRYNHSVMSV